MQKANIYIVLMVVGLSGLIGCQPEGPDPDAVILARVGNAYLTLDEALDYIPEHVLASDSTAAINTFRSNWVTRQVLYQDARRQGVHLQDEVQRRLIKSEKDILNDAYREIIVRNAARELTVTNQEVHDYYAQFRDQFVLQERYLRMRHVVTATLDESRNAKAELLRGIPWEIVVDRYALNKEETLRRAEQFFPQSAVLTDNPPMRDYLRVIGLTEISPIRSHNGQFHFIQIMEDRPRGDHPDVDWMFDQIREWLIIEKRRRAVRIFEQNLVMQAEANNEIEIFN